MNTNARLPLEPAGPDFPYYNGIPNVISVTGWIIILAGVVAGFAALVTPFPIADGALSNWLHTILFVGLPLLGLMIATPTGWNAIFARVGFREVKLMIVFALLNIFISAAIGTAIKFLGTTAGNAIIADAKNLSSGEQVNFFAKVGVQLLGEELITMLPFLALLSLCRSWTGLSRNAAVLLAWLASAVAFGLIHLPTYEWNFVQCLVVIGGARLVLSWAYIWSKNIWVSTGAHILNDWILIAVITFLAPLAGSV